MSLQRGRSRARCGRLRRRALLFDSGVLTRRPTKGLSSRRCNFFFRSLLQFGKQRGLVYLASEKLNRIKTFQTKTVNSLGNWKNSGRMSFFDLLVEEDIGLRNFRQIVFETLTGKGSVDSSMINPSMKCLSSTGALASGAGSSVITGSKSTSCSPSPDVVPGLCTAAESAVTSAVTPGSVSSWLSGTASS